MVFALISFLTGVALGQFFKGLILPPALLVLLAVVVAFMHTDAFWPIALTAMASWASMQIGYFVGSIIDHGLASDSSARYHASLGHSARRRTAL